MVRADGGVDSASKADPAYLEALAREGVGPNFLKRVPVSALLRTISIVPGGLGAFEAASVLTLKIAGVPIAVALAATLLFPGLSFWLPMVPGLVFSRGARDDDAAVDALGPGGRRTKS